jgi:hypothetical protein
LSALTNYQSGQTFPPIATTMLGKVAAGLNPTDTALIGGPPPTPAVIEALLDAITALDVALGF